MKTAELNHTRPIPKVATRKGRKSSDLVSTVADTIAKYHMIADASSPIPVAFSGGKDSLATILILCELGYDVRPVIVDRGDDPAFNADEISKTLKRIKGLHADILKLRDKKYLGQICEFAAKRIQDNLNKVDHLGLNESMCTPCYNARTAALIQYSLECGATEFAIGQHLNDMLTSFMKCYWSEKYFLALTKPLGLSYDGFKMRNFIAASDIDMSYVREMAKEGRAVTDDPPVERVIEGMRLIRPLAGVRERDIVAFAGNYPHQSTNCSWRERQPSPFRLLVQRDLDKRIACHPEIEDELYHLVVLNVNRDGTAKCRPRNSRGVLYPGFKSFIEKS